METKGVPHTLIALILAVACFATGLHEWTRAVLALALAAVLCRGGIKAGYTLFVAAVVLALSHARTRDGSVLEALANALNQGVTGVPTVRLLGSLLALAWLGEVLAEGGAAKRLAEALKGRGGLQSLVSGLVPATQTSEAGPDKPAALLWFSRLGGLALPVSAGLVVVSELGHLPLVRTASLMAPLALAMAAVGLLTLARSLPGTTEEGAVPQNDGGGLMNVLLPVALLLTAALCFPQTEIPIVRATVIPWRVIEGVVGLVSPLALGAALACVLTARLLNLSMESLGRCLRRACTADLVVFVVGLKVLEQAVAVPLGYEESVGQSVAKALEAIPSHGMSVAALACLVLPALMGFLLGGAAAGLAATLPFLLPAMGPGGDPRLLMLSWTGAFLGGLFPGRSSEVRWQLALPAALMALLAAVLTSAG